MKKLTKREALIECEKMWKWIADNSNRELSAAALKVAYMRENNIDHVAQNCYACEYNQQHKNPGQYACNCILRWKHKTCYYFENDSKASEYILWAKARDNSDRKKYALQIVQLARDAINRLPKRSVKVSECSTKES